MVMKAKSGAPEKKPATERVVKTSNRYGKLTAEQLKRAVERVTKEQR